MSNVRDVKSKDIEITLTDGVKRTLKYDLNAMAEMEDKYGSVDEAFKKLEQNSIKAVRFFLWAGLVHDDPSLTEQQVGSLIDMRYLSNIMNTLTDAFDSDMPKKDEVPVLEESVDSPN